MATQEWRDNLLLPPDKVLIWPNLTQHMVYLGVEQAIRTARRVCPSATLQAFNFDEKRQMLIYDNDSVHPETLLVTLTFRQEGEDDSETPPWSLEIHA